MPDLTLSSQLAYAQRLVDIGDAAGAVVVCRHILSALPRCVQGYAVLAEAVHRLGQVKRAEELYQRVLSADPQNCRASLGMSLVQASLGLQGAARAWRMRARDSLLEGAQTFGGWLESEVARSPETGQALSRGGLAYLMLRSGLVDRALVEFQLALAEAPWRDDLALGLAESHYRRAEWAAAVEVGEGLLLRLPDCLKALLLCGRMLLGSGADPRARDMLRRAQALDPENRLAQQLFGSDSPLPLRAVRVPFAMREPLALPYLAVELEQEEEEDVLPPPRLEDLL